MGKTTIRMWMKFIFCMPITQYYSSIVRRLQAFNNFFVHVEQITHRSYDLPVKRRHIKFIVLGFQVLNANSQSATSKIYIHLFLYL